MIQTSKPSESFVAFFTELSSLQRHQYTESLLKDKIKLTYSKAIDLFTQNISLHEKLHESLENFRIFKECQFSELPNDVDCLLLAAIDKLTGIFHLIIKNQGAETLSFYELDSFTQQLTDKGVAPFMISPAGMMNSIFENDLYELQLIVKQVTTIKNIWENGNFNNTTKDTNLNEISSRFPRWSKKNGNRIPYIDQTFRNIIDYLDFQLKTDSSANIFPSPRNPNGVIECWFSLAHLKIDPEDIEMILVSKLRKIKKANPTE